MWVVRHGERADEARARALRDGGAGVAVGWGVGGGVRASGGEAARRPPGSVMAALRVTRG